MVVPPAKPAHPYGRRVILCGNWHVSEDWKISLAIAFVLISAVSLLLSSTIDYTNYKNGKVDDKKVLIGWTVAAAVNFILAVAGLTNLFLCVFTEPGILTPKIHYDLSGEQNPDPVPENFEDLEVNQWTRKIQVKDEKTGEVLMDYNEEICRTCQIWRPPRSGHCYQENVCIEEFDHKCTVIGAAIGKRNFGYFYMFNLICSILACTAVMTVIFSFVFAVKWDEVAKSGKTHDQRMNQWRVASGVIVILEAVITAIFNMQFAVRYTRYACSNITAKDEFGWRQEAKELAVAQRRGKSDCTICLDRSCNVRLPPSHAPF